MYLEYSKLEHFWKLTLSHHSIPWSCTNFDLLVLSLSGWVRQLHVFLSMYWYVKIRTAYHGSHPGLWPPVARPGLIKNHLKCLATGGQTSVPSPSKTFYIPNAVFFKAPRPLDSKCWPSNHGFLSFVQLVSICNVASEKHLARFNSVSQSKITFPVKCRRANPKSVAKWATNNCQFSHNILWLIPALQYVR